MKNMATTRSFLAALAAIVLTLTLAPLTAQAAGNVKAIQLGAGVLAENVNTPNAATVWFGKNHEDDSASWRVIGYEDKGVGLLQNGIKWGADGITLLAAEYMGTKTFDANQPHSCYYAENPNGSETEDSDLKKAVDAIAGKLTDEEKAAVAKRELLSGGYDGAATDCVAGNKVTDAVMWPLSTREAIAVAQDLRKTTDSWWLRSPGYNDSSVVCVSKGGDVTHDQHYNNDPRIVRAVRPAFNLDLGSVLFTSAAVGGKISGAAGADALEEVGKNAGNEWKVTLKDERTPAFSASLSDSTSAASVEAGGTVKLNYENAWTQDTTNNNEYVSVILKKQGASEILYYGNLAATSGKPESAQDVPLTIPSGLAAGDYTLGIFAEQCNGDKKTDYASAVAEISLTVTAKPAPPAPDPDPTPTTTLTIATPSDLPGGTAGEGYEQQLTATGAQGATEWSVVKGALPKGLSLSKDGKISGTPREAGTFTFTVQVTDASDKSATKDMTLVIEKAKGPAAPTGLVATPPTAQGMTDGTISGVDPTMEWSADDGETWTDCPATGPITGLAPGEYLIRYKATEAAGPGDAATVTVPESGAHVVTVRLIDGGDGGPVVVLELTSGGAPVAGMDLWAWLVPVGDGKEQGAFLGTTDEAGRLVLDVDALVWATGDRAGERASIPAGTWRIRIEIHDANGDLWTGVSSDTVSLPATSPIGTSGGGCFNVGFGGLALMACAMVALKRRG